MEIFAIRIRDLKAIQRQMETAPSSNLIIGKTTDNEEKHQQKVKPKGQ